jgi:putative toxin-antitoxin system antitoxin component (TIGR02293 family)
MPRRAGATPSRGSKPRRASWDVNQYVRRLASATPIEIVDIEREGVRGSFIKELAKRLQIPSSRLFGILGIPKATAEKKASTGEMVTGSAGQAAIGIARLLGLAEGMLAGSAAPEAKGFDAGKWLGEWIERTQPALGGRKPADLLDTPTGLGVVARLLGAIESGAYQ